MVINTKRLVKFLWPPFSAVDSSEQLLCSARALSGPEANHFRFTFWPFYFSCNNKSTNLGMNQKLSIRMAAIYRKLIKTANPLVASQAALHQMIRWAYCMGDSEVKQKQQQVKNNNWAFTLSHRNHKNEGRNLPAWTWRVLNNIAWVTRFKNFLNKMKKRSKDHPLSSRNKPIRRPNTHDT